MDYSSVLRWKGWLLLHLCRTVQNRNRFARGQTPDLVSLCWIAWGFCPPHSTSKVIQQHSVPDTFSTALKPPPAQSRMTASTRSDQSWNFLRHRNLQRWNELVSVPHYPCPEEFFLICNLNLVPIWTLNIWVASTLQNSFSIQTNKNSILVLLCISKGDYCLWGEILRSAR